MRGTNLFWIAILKIILQEAHNVMLLKEIYTYAPHASEELLYRRLVDYYLTHFHPEKALPSLIQKLPSSLPLLKDFALYFTGLNALACLLEQRQEALPEGLLAQAKGGLKDLTSRFRNASDPKDIQTLRDIFNLSIVENLRGKNGVDPIADAFWSAFKIGNASEAEATPRD